MTPACVCECVRVYVCVCVCIYLGYRHAHKNTHTNTHTHTHTQQTLKPNTLTEALVQSVDKHTATRTRERHTNAEAPATENALPLQDGPR
jgi:hypothetical protein